MIAIDFGLKRLGVAKSIEGIVFALAPIIRKNRNQASYELRKILIENNAKKLIVGISEDGAIGDRVHHFLRLVDFKGEIVFINEDYSSIQAHDLMVHKKYQQRRRARKDGRLDSLSAVVILNRYLENIRFESISNQVLESKADICDILDSKKDLSENTQALRSEDNTGSIDSKQNIESNKQYIQNRLQLFSNSPHKPVLLNEVMNAFNDVKSGVIIDCTFGLGGMSETILSEKDCVKVLAIDRDKEALVAAKKLQKRYEGRFLFLRSDFSSGIKKILEIKECESVKLDSKNNLDEGLAKFLKNEKISGILADIGVSSPQFDNEKRGFSFKSNSLDMRMDVHSRLDAKYILNHYSKIELENIFKNYGEIREYKKLAYLIVNARQKHEIDAEILQNIARQIHSKSSLNHSTLIYQALRIEVNDELGQLKGLLGNIENALNKDHLKDHKNTSKLESILKNAIVVLISFHSLEDRMVKDCFKLWARGCVCSEDMLKCECGGDNAKGEIMYKKPLIASEYELSFNPRSRSAKLRAFKCR